MAEQCRGSSSEAKARNGDVVGYLRVGVGGGCLKQISTML